MKELLLWNGLNGDILQIISQYSMDVYFKLRLVCKEVKEIIDEVLPIGSNTKGVSISNRDWRVNFLERAHQWCGFKLLDQRGFKDWMKAMSQLYPRKKYANIVEKFCRDYLPKDGFIAWEVLECLCLHNRKEYVCELWQEANRKSVSVAERFYPNCIQEICKLDDFKLFKMVYDEYVTPNTNMNVYGKALENSWGKSWENFRYLVENRRIPYKEDYLGIPIPFFVLANLYWKQLSDIRSHDKDKVLKAIEQHGLLLLFVDESFQKDKDVVMAAVKRNGNALAFADESLRKERDIVMTAVKELGIALQYADESLRKDKEIVMAAIKEVFTSDVLQYADESLRNDKDIVMAAVEHSFYDLQHIGDVLRKDRDIVMTAVKQGGRALEYSDQSLRNDKEIVMTAVEKSGCSLQYADQSLRKDKDIVLKAVRNDGRALLFADESLQRNPEVALEAIKNDKRAMKFADKSLFQDKEFIQNAVELDESFFDYADESLKMDKEFVKKVM